MTRIVVVGGGSAGGAVATRLSEDTRNTVILIESGPDYPEPELVPEDLADADVMSVTKHDWGLQAHFFEPEGSRALQPYPRGRVVGGSSAVNAAMALRGTPEDFAAWVALGNAEWSWNDVLPYYVRLERDLDFGGEPYHGGQGPVPVRRLDPTQWAPAAVAFREAMSARGFAQAPDINAPGASGICPVPRNLIDGKRASSLATYLTDARSRPNFEVLADAHVVRVIFEDRRAVGVEIERGGQHEVIRGDKVVLSAGAIHSPQILMLSGVGPRATLDELGIPVVQDSPGVGATLDDHPIVPVVTLTTTPSEFTGVRVGLRATSEIGAALGLLDDYMVFAAILDPFTMNLDVDTRGKQAFSLIFNLGRPLSRGWLTISSADHREHPELHMNFLSDPRDLARVLAGVRQLYHLARAEPLASLIDSIPGLDDDIVADDSRLEAWVRKVVTTGYHGSGTCRIGPDDDPMAVVDQHLAVRGVENLWVADASINPVIPTAFTNLTAVMVGERLADWLRNDAEVNGVTTNESMAHA